MEIVHSVNDASRHRVLWALSLFSRSTTKQFSWGRTTNRIRRNKTLTISKAVRMMEEHRIFSLHICRTSVMWPVKLLVMK